MAKSSEEISRYNTTGGKTDSNLANDALHLGGVPADDFATQKYVQDYHNAKEQLLKEYIDEQDALKLQQAKSYTDVAISNQDFSNFAEITDVEASHSKLSEDLAIGLNNQKNYTDEKVGALARDVNSNFDDVGQAITILNSTTQELFTSVSNGKSNVAAAITDQGVETASDASFDTMATNIRKIQTGGGEPDPYYVNTGDGTAVADDIMLGKTAYVKGEKIYGSHVDTGVDTSDATATPYDIVSGKTAYIDGQKITGILDLSGEKPTYGGDDGVEKIYGGGYGDYSVDSITNISISQSNNNFLLYNSNTLETIARVTQNQSSTVKEIIFEYIYNNSVAMTRNTDISSVISTARTQLLNYADYTSEEDIHFDIKGITSVNAPTPYITIQIGNDKKEKILALLPLVETHTPQNGATVITWEIDFVNVVYHTIVRSVFIFDSSTKYNVSENGDTITFLYYYSGGNITGQLIKVDVDNISITNAFDINVSNAPYQIEYIHPTSTDKVIIFDCFRDYMSYHWYTVVMLLDSNYNAVRVLQVGNNDSFRFTDDLQSCVKDNGEVYAVSIDWNNYNINLTKINKQTVYLSQYMCKSKSFDLIGNKFVITMDSNYKNHIFKFDPLGDVLLESVDENDHEIGIYEQGYGKLGNNIIYNKVSNNILRTIKMKKDYGKLVALKYNGEYFYKQEGGILTAGQPDVRAGKSFIGWMGYPEIGTMEVEE